MIKKLLCLCTLAVALVSAAWASTYSQSATYGNSPHFSYWSTGYGSGTVFTCTVSGFGPGNGVSFVQNASNGSFLAFVGPGAQTSQSFYGTQTTTALSGYTQVILGISATSNGVGGYCTSTLTVGW